VKLGYVIKTLVAQEPATYRTVGRDWGYAKDYVAAMWLMLNADRPDDYVIATGETYSVREFVELAFGHLDLDWQQYVEIDPHYFRPAEVDCLSGDASKARQELGWKPKVTFEQLVKLMGDHDLRLAVQEAEAEEQNRVAANVP
jgi:GDPmannose 4,6-dehydratase